MRRLVVILMAVCVVVPVGAAAQALPDSYAFAPVVVTGEAVAPLAGATPGRVAAFRYEDGAWVPVPVQVDEREEVDLSWVYNGRDNVRCETTNWCFERAPFRTTVYTDRHTYLGADSDPFIDADDEVVFMAQDAGARAPQDAEAPPGVRGSHGVEVEVRVSGSGERAYVYVFWQDGRYPLDAGRPYVDYRFQLLSGDYRRTYKPAGIAFDPSQPSGNALGANPEDSEVVTAFYRRHFSDRWIEDALALRAGGASGDNLLDRYKIKSDEACGRTEYTGSAARGALIANVSGPVRAIRSVLGFNSGPFMQQDMHFYERYVYAAHYFRTHPLGGGPYSYNDYSEAAVGMLRYSNLSPEGLLVDGQPDKPEVGFLEWEVLQGAQGTLAVAYDVASDIPDLAVDAYYADQAPAQSVQCTGDDALYGAGGAKLRGPLPNTDPTREGDLHTLRHDRHMLHEAPSLPLDSARAFIAATRQPLAVQAAPYAVRLGEDPDPPPGIDPPPGGPIFLDTPRPNPSVGLARVTYWLAEETVVRLALYDLAGRRLAVIDQGRRAAGYHDVALSAGGFPTGTYLVRLDTPQGGASAPFVRH